MTARDIVETGNREADLATQAEKLSVQELVLFMNEAVKEIRTFSQ